MNKTISLKTVILIIVAVVIIAASAVGAVLYLNQQKDDLALESESNSSMVLPDANAKEGGLDGETLDKLWEEMQEKAEKGAIVVNFSESMIFPDGKSEGKVKIANPVENNYPMQFLVTLEDTGEKVYESGLVSVGSYITSIKLTKELEAGTYPAVLTYHAFDEENQEFVSSVNVSVVITIES